MSDTLKPNGISHTVYPDQPAEDFNEWTANFTRQEVARDLNKHKEKFDNLWAWTYFKNAGEADDYKTKFDNLWADMKKDMFG